MRLGSNRAYIFGTHRAGLTPRLVFGVFLLSVVVDDYCRKRCQLSAVFKADMTPLWYRSVDKCSNLQ